MSSMMTVTMGPKIIWATPKENVNYITHYVY